MCLRKGCGRKYQPRRWNQRYCQDPECLRQLRRWQAAQRQARRRQDDAIKAEHAARHFPRPPPTRPGVSSRPRAAFWTASGYSQRAATTGAAAVIGSNGRAGRPSMALPGKLPSLGQSVRYRLLPWAQAESQA